METETATVFEWFDMVLGIVVSWPVVGIAAILVFRKPITKMIGNIESGELYGHKFIVRANERREATLHTARVSADENLEISAEADKMRNEINLDYLSAWPATVEAARQYLVRVRKKLADGREPKNVLEIMSLLPEAEREVFKAVKDASGQMKGPIDSIPEIQREDFVDTAKRFIAAINIKDPAEH